MKEGALALEEPCHEQAHRLGQREHHEEVKEDLVDTKSRHAHHRSARDARARRAGTRTVPPRSATTRCSPWSQPFAKLYEVPARHQRSDTDGEKREIKQHGKPRQRRGR